MQKGVHLQIYFGRNATHGPLNVVEMRKTPNDTRVLSIPWEPYLHDKKEKESFKQLTTLTINRMTTHYTCFTKAFAVFVSDKEINTTKSSILKYF